MTEKATMKVLIVDDNEQARWMIRHYLRECANEFRECDDGAEAVSAYTEFQPDWVLMDWEMKQVHGLAATRRIIADFPEARILIVTNYAPALAANKACPAEKTKVTLVLTPLSEKYLHAFTPSLVIGNLTTICSCKSANSSPSLIIPS